MRAGEQDALRDHPFVGAGAQYIAHAPDSIQPTALDSDAWLDFLEGFRDLQLEVVLSPHTVEDHVKSLYEKLGVASRQELVARVFLDEYLPEVARQTPLTSRGRFDRE